MIVPVAVAIALSELWNQRRARFYQAVMFLPYFLSWIIISYLVFVIFQSSGTLNTMIMTPLGLGRPDWYRTVGAWPPILIITNLWRFTGYNAVFYLAALSGISRDYYEASMIDGAKKRQQIWYITLPHLRPIIIILSLLALGRIFNSDFGLFFNIPMSRSTLFPVTEVLDTFIYRAMISSTDFGRPVAASLFQSVVGLITIITANFIVRKVDAESSLF
jgi:putative aldouronate transport system permease protein